MTSCWRPHVTHRPSFNTIHSILSSHASQRL
ncbi:hypothetical protein E2C01_075105 [Portunus trituberculatus]|uniref:Uncharacterized protein n=1 Tax=Portunus trituberculatus TaxID=210409 RepID=A0A5B7IE67_PORTR|nr:hypothetical protein [Portunus trituberculatus]